MRRILLCLLAGLLLWGQAAFADGENLLQNGDFEDLVDGWPSGWAEDMWVYDPGVTYIESRTGGQDGGRCILIENVGKNDARLVQRVEVQPDTVYRLSGYVKVEAMGDVGAGASLSVIGAYTAFPALVDTGGEWAYLETYIQTDLSQHELTLGPRLGDYSADNTGKAYFDALSLVRVDDVPPGTGVIAITDYSTWDSGAQDDASAPAAPKQTAFSATLPALIIFLLLALCLWVVRMQGVSIPGWAIFVLLAAAAAIRLYCMAAYPGHETDMGCFYAWSSRMAEVGPANFYSPDYFCDYPPGYMYLLWLTGLIMRAFGASMDTDMGRVIVKIMPMLADLATIYCIYRLARRSLGQAPALLLSALYALSPAIILDSAVWGQVDAVLTLGLLGTLVLVMRGNWKAALPVYVLTVLMKPQALMAGPIGLAALLMDLLPWKENGRRVLKDALLGLVLAAGVVAAAVVPFVLHMENPLGWLLELYTGTLGSYAYASLNAGNLYFLLGYNWASLDTLWGPLTIGAWGALLMALVVVGLMALYAVRRDRQSLPFIAAMLFIGLYLLGIKMHERYLFPAFALLLYAYIKKPDWRILLMFVGYSVTFTITCAWVLMDMHLPQTLHLGGGTLSAVNLLLGGVGLWVLISPAPRPLPMPVSGQKRMESRLHAIAAPSRRIIGMRPRDWAVMAGITLGYAAIAYTGLGATAAPQTGWTSTGATEEVVLDLGETKEFELLYYGGINSRDYIFTLSFSQDDQAYDDYTPQKIAPGDCFRWQFVREPFYDEYGEVTDWGQQTLVFTARYIRLTVDGPAMTLMELVPRGLDGQVLPAEDVRVYGARAENASDPWMLVDEGDTAPDHPTYYNGTYFDEIYHARTGYEHAHGMSTYEWTHPPLGKIFIMLGIKLFGMTPLGWRFFGTLAGVLMVPAMYLMGKLLFGRTRYGLLAAFVMAFDMMHLTQTRIATIDSYAVLFIILMYLCMFAYMKMNLFQDGLKTLIPLGLSGVFMGLGCASKWICMYAGVGLAVLFFWSLARRFLQWRAGLAAGEGYAERVADFPRLALATLLFCVVFFLVIPFAIYYFSYIPHFAFDGGLTWDRFWSTQVGIFDYHARLVDDHSFQSPWYEWPLMLKPMYYYDGKAYLPEGTVSTIMCMGNPAVWWVGLAAFGYVLYRWLRPLFRGVSVKDHRPAMLLVAFAAQFLPWVLVPRSTFIYHYFGSLPFVMLCIVYAMERIDFSRPRIGRWLMPAYMAAVVVLFVGFYPIATGVPIPEGWAVAMNWLRFLKLPGWKFRGWLYF